MAAPGETGETGTVVNQSDIVGPNSLLWKYAGDNRMYLTGFSGGLLQLAYPPLGTGVIQHSDFFERPWDRIFNSGPEIIGAIYDEDPQETGQRIKDLHRDIKGVDEHGRKYHALNPGTWGWAHNTFVFMVMEAADRFSDEELTVPKRQRLYDETVELWYRNYDMPDVFIPKGLAEYEEYMDFMYREKLERTPAFEHAVKLAVTRTLEPPFKMPKIGWEVGSRLLHLTAIGGLPEVVRKRLEIPWNQQNAARLRSLEAAVKRGWRILPENLRYQERALLGMEREAQKLKASPA